MEPFVYYMVYVDGSERACRENNKGIVFITEKAAVTRAREIAGKPGVTEAEVDTVFLTKAGVEEFVRTGLILSN